MSVKKEIAELVDRLTKSERQDLLNSLRARYEREQEELARAMFRERMVKMILDRTKS